MLRELLGATPLDFVVLVGSINSLMGAPGLSDYSAANAVFDAFANSEVRPAAWKRVLTLNYGPWRDVGMAARLHESAAPAKRGDAFREVALSSDDGTEAFLRALASGRTQVIAFPRDFPRIMELLRTNAPPAASAEATARVGAPDETVANVSTTYEPPADETERRLAAIWSELLGVSRVGADDDFFELGGHSLLATRVLARVEQSLGARLTLRDVFEAPTVRKLAERLGAAAVASPKADDSDREELEF